MSSGRWQVAQLSVAWLAAPLDDPRLADFVGNLERVNTLGEASLGFVWRHPADEVSLGSAVAGSRIVLNLSVWNSVDNLAGFVFGHAHAEMFGRRREWFTQEDQPRAVLWWVAAGHRPSIDEADQRLARLASDGPTRDAFTLSQRFPAPV